MGVHFGPFIGENIAHVVISKHRFCVTGKKVNYPRNFEIFIQGSGQGKVTKIFPR